MEITLKTVEDKDWDFILDLRNHKQIRKFMTSDKIISKNTHYTYLKNQKLNPKFLNRIIYFENKRVGYVRISGEDVSIFIHPNFQGKGIATIALELIQPIAKNNGFVKLVGKVFPDNKQSEKIFLKNGFVHSLNWLEKFL
jgi:RimJ/RimL family protein N-acetyltransferase